MISFGWTGLSARARTIVGLSLSASLVLAPAVPASAVPARSVTTELLQPDGKTIEATLYGDEFSHGYETADGHTIVRGPTGFWEYATARRGRLVSSGLRVGSDRPRGLPRHLRESLQARSLAGRTARRLQGASLDSPNGGDQPSLALLVEYTDEPSTTDPSDWHEVFFGASGSVSDYYDEVSYGALNLTPAQESNGDVDDGVVGWLPIGAEHPNPAGGQPGPERQITHDAIVASNDYVDYSIFDKDGNDAISADELHITVIVAGYETSYGNPCGKSVWGHNWDLAVIPMVDGVEVGNGARGGSYNQFGERHCDAAVQDEHPATIGIMVHEMGHDLRLPDLYDTNGGSEGIGEWSVMASGSWTQASPTDWAGSSPVHMDAWSKWYEGWITPQQITGNQTGVALTRASEQADVVQLLDNPGGLDWTFNLNSGTGQYFLVENRQPSGYDAGLPGCGLLVWHIDEDRSRFNDANSDENHKLVDLEEADGNNHLDLGRGTGGNRGDAGDPFRGKKVFNAASNPSSDLYGGDASRVTVSDFSGNCAPTMTADFSTSSKTATKLAVSKAAKKIKASGSLTPDHPGEALTVILYRRRSNGTWKKLSPKHPKLNATSDFKVNFGRPAPGRCRIKASFPADGDHLGSNETKQFRC